MIEIFSREDLDSNIRVEKGEKELEIKYPDCYY